MYFYLIFYHYYYYIIIVVVFVILLLLRENDILALFLHIRNKYFLFNYLFFVWSAIDSYNYRTVIADSYLTWCPLGSNALWGPTHFRVKIEKLTPKCEYAIYQRTLGSRVLKVSTESCTDLFSTCDIEIFEVEFMMAVDTLFDA
jgi:hypothetical protein